MTHDPDMHDSHTDGLSHEGAEASAWHGDQPPVDDFADPSHHGDEAASVSEDTGEVEEEVVEKQKSKLIPMVFVLAVLLLGGGGAYWWFTRVPTDGEKPVATAVTPPVKTEPVAPTTGAIATDTPLPSTAIAEPTPASTPDVPMVPPSKLADAPVPEKVPTPQEAANLLPPVAAEPPIPLLAGQKTPQAAPSISPAPVPTVPPVLVAPISAPTAPDQRVVALSSRVDELERLLSQTSQQLNEVTAKNAKTEEVNARLMKLEKRVDQQARHVVPTHTEIADENFYAKKPEPKVQKPVVTHTKAVPAPKVAPKPVEAVKAVPAVVWIIRAAIPNEAWVAKDSSTSALQHVKVGDVLSGIGRITAIHQKADKWVVDGTEGSIRY